MGLQKKSSIFLVWGLFKQYYFGTTNLHEEQDDWLYKNWMQTVSTYKDAPKRFMRKHRLKLKLTPYSKEA